MKQSNVDIHRSVAELLDGPHSFAMVVVLRAEGSAPQCAGAKALVDATGRIWGTVGGDSSRAKRNGARSRPARRGSL